MEREQLVAEAREAGQHAAHNLQMIRKNPDVMLPGRIEDAEDYLNNMIRIAEVEMKNDRLAGQSLGLKSRLENLLMSILTPKREKHKATL
ncbi:hypothetical protein [Paenibacillus odorifer]|uniref:Uncharacterized protein n=1 Tax=Paenibacillus odorifer TaxID=189426 RepID=A0ABX3GCP0_9BACL|nr:hypothetical protein [Paenibacillus odorifer]OMC67711.1 hypothetical protein BK125_28300 [Paenibacillus odorifer]OMC99016.1 hypothetical protein BSO21_33045 [Paenibacillus odorifer]